MTRHQNPSTLLPDPVPRRPWSAAVCVICALILVLTATAQGNSPRTITLSKTARATGPTITLGEIADLEGDGTQALAHIKIAALQSGQTKKTVTLALVRKQLNKQERNWSLLTLRGHMRCQVIRKKNDAKTTDLATHEPDKENVQNSASGDQTPAPSHVSAHPSAHPSAPPSAHSASNPRDKVSVEQPTTLKALIVERISQMTDKNGSELDISFRKRDAERLKRGLIGKRYELEPVSRTGLGRTPIRVRRYEGLDIAERFTVTATVQWKTLALVSAARIKRGQTITTDDLEVRQVTLDDDQTKPLTNKQHVLGQTAARSLDAGTALFADDVESPVLIERGERITVRCLSGGLVIRTVARARSDGTRGQRIPVRNLASGETYKAKVTGRGEAAVTTTPRQAKPADKPSTTPQTSKGDTSSPTTLANAWNQAHG